MHFLIPFPNLLTYHTFLAAPAIFFFLANAQRCSSAKAPEIPGQLRSTIDKSEQQRVQKQIAHVELGMFPASSDQNRSLYLPMVKLSLGEVTSQFWCSLAFAHCKLLLSHGWRRGGMGKDNMLRGRVIIANQAQVLIFSTFKFFCFCHTENLQLYKEIHLNDM